MNVFTNVISFLSIVIITRGLSVSDYGTYTSFQSWGLLFTSVLILGIPSIITREIAEKGLRSLSNTYRATVPFLTFGLLVNTLLWSFLYFFDILDHSFILINVLSLSSLLWVFIDSFFYGFKRYFLGSIINFCYALFFLFCLLLAEELKLDRVILVFTIITLVKVFTYGIFFTGLLGRDLCFSFDFNQIKLTFFKLRPYILLSVLGIVSGNLISIVLEQNASGTELAIYNSSARLATVIFSLCGTFINLISPHFFSIERDEKKFKTYIILGLDILFCFLFVIIFLLYVSGVDMTKTLFGQNYAGNGRLFIYQMFSASLLLVFSFIGLILNASHKESVLVKLSIVFNVVYVCYIYFGSSYGAYTLSKYIVTSLILNMLLHLYVLRVVLRIKVLHYSLIPILILLILRLTFDENLIPSTFKEWSFYFSILLKFLILVLVIFRSYNMLSGIKKILTEKLKLGAE